jgi:hypothetical protein
MSAPPQPPPDPAWQQPQPSQPRRSPWGAIVVTVLALAVGGVAGVAIAGNDNGQTKTVTKTTGTKATTNKTDVTVSVPTATTTVEKTVTVTVPRADTGTTDTAP